MAFIEVNNISKEFKVFRRQKGFLNSLKSIFHREYDMKKAIEDVSFTINKGELVGYIGPNGAGKSTTIKILSGVLLPSEGQVVVDGRVPYKNRKENAMHIGLVFGQRSQLHWDLPIEDSLILHKKMYRIDESRYKRNVKFFTELLDMEDFIHNPVRQLSLGQKMRAELAAALLHDPEILYLDEPTIGLDIIAKSRIRDFIKEVNKEKKTTVILTTHDMDDIEQICDRLIMIDKGHIIYDGILDSFKQRYGGDHLAIVEFDKVNIVMPDSRLQIIKEEGCKKHIAFNKQDIGVGDAITLITRSFNVKDISLKEPEIEGIVKKIYENKGILTEK